MSTLCRIFEPRNPSKFKAQSKFPIENHSQVPNSICSPNFKFKFQSKSKFKSQQQVKFKSKLKLKNSQFRPKFQIVKLHKCQIPLPSLKLPKFQVQSGKPPSNSNSPNFRISNSIQKFNVQIQSKKIQTFKFRITKFPCSNSECPKFYVKFLVRATSQNLCLPLLS